MEKIFIDSTLIPMGRLATLASKYALAGNKVFVLNSEKAIISGNKEDTFKKWIQRRARGGTALKGPYHSKSPEKILKRTIRGMLPNYRWGRGRDAWRRIRCYLGIPEEYKNEKFKKINAKTPKKYVFLEELSKIL